MTERDADEQGHEDGRRDQARSQDQVPAGDEQAFFSEPHGDLGVRLGKRQIDVDNRWEAASIINDLMTGLWFVTGSILYLFEVAENAALVLYLVGSLQLLARAIIRLARRTHVRGMQSRSRPRIYRPDMDHPGAQGDEHR